MPLLKNAKKKLRQDKKRTAANVKVKEAFKKLVKKAKVAKTAESLSAAFSGIDKATKKNILNKNKAAHMKSSLSKIIDGTAVTTHDLKKKVVKKTKGVATKKKTSSKKK